MIAAAIATARANRKILTLLLALAVAAAFYIQWQAAAIDRANARTTSAKLLGYSDTVCAALNVTAPAEGAPLADRDAWAARCLGEANRLGRIEGDLANGSLDAVLGAMERQHGKEQVDAALAAEMSKRTADAVARMEAANAAIEDDRVGPGWACAVNELAGLRAPGC
ncbi:MAG: hypothetical protein ACT6TH_14600 [Brevundimonas sp.]|uniref:hypothetical protein n=1 Tax=Brevundimonas sp. TaxID=1871086 RepID=UPI004034086D